MLHSFTFCRIITVCIGLILHGNFVEDYDYFVSKLTENPQLTHACPFDIWRNQTQYPCTYRARMQLPGTCTHVVPCWIDQACACFSVVGKVAVGRRRDS